MLHDRIQKTLSESNLKWDLTPHHRRQKGCPSQVTDGGAEGLVCEGPGTLGENQ